MKVDEAQTLLQRLCTAFEKNLKPDTFAEYVRNMTPCQYGTMSKAVSEIIVEEKFFPKIADLIGYYRTALREYQAKTDPVNSYSDTPDGKWHIYRQHRIGQLTREQYWVYVYDIDFRIRQDDEWRREYTSIVAKLTEAQHDYLAQEESRRRM